MVLACKPVARVYLYTSICEKPHPCDVPVCPSSLSTGDTFRTQSFNYSAVCPIFHQVIEGLLTEEGREVTRKPPGPAAAMMNEQPGPASSGCPSSACHKCPKTLFYFSQAAF